MFMASGFDLVQARLVLVGIWGVIQQMRDSFVSLFASQVKKLTYKIYRDTKEEMSTTSELLCTVLIEKIWCYPKIIVNTKALIQQGISKLRSL